MKQTTIKRTHRLTEVRLTEAEKIAFLADYQASYYPSMGDFIRAKLFDKTYSDYKKKQYEAEIVAGEMMTELGRMGKNINQIAKNLNTYKDGKIRKSELAAIVSTAQLLEKIQKILSQPFQNDSQNK